MSAPFPALTTAVKLADRRFLTDGEVSGDGQGTTTFPTSQRVDWLHKLDQLRPGPSTTLTMVATTARLRHVDKRRPVAVKQNAWEDSGAHPKHIRAERWTGGAMKKLIVGHSKHGEACCVDGSVLVTAVDKKVTQ